MAKTTKPEKTTLDLPAEVLRNVFGRLKYPDITKVKQTCGSLKACVTDDVVQQCMLQLENDWTTAQNSDFYVSDARRKLELENMGYLMADIGKLDSCLACYGCLNVFSAGRFLWGIDQGRLSSHAAILTASFQTPINALPTRLCLVCLLQSQKYLEPAGKRWLRRDGPRALATGEAVKSWLLICRGCNQRKETEHAPKNLQRSADLCDECWTDGHRAWFDFKRKLSAHNSEIKQYLIWMNRVELGLENGWKTAPTLQALDVSDWREVINDSMEEFKK